MTRIGPAGFAYKDWWGIVYPAKKPRGFSELAFLARYFKTLEINVSFYRPTAAATAQTWLKRVEAHPDFRFTAKLWRGFTHERSAGAVDEQLVKDGFAPFLEAGKFGALLLQFPWSFRNTPENRVYIARLCARFAEFPLVLEVRHGTWSEPGILDFLSELNLGLCNIDQPLFKRSIAPTAITTSTVGYIRLHGRNYKSWFTENTFAGERYNYLYSVEELEPWVDRIQAVEQSAQETYVVTNNHYLGKGIVNAFEIASILEKKPLPMPAELVARYPELLPFAEPESEPNSEPEQLSF